MESYQDFLEGKRARVDPSGFEPGELNPMLLFDFMRVEANES